MSRQEKSVKMSKAGVETMLNARFKNGLWICGVEYPKVLGGIWCWSLK